MALSLTPRELEVLAVVLQEMPEIPNVDFKVVAPKIGIKLPKNARSAFKKIWDKLKAGNGGGAIKEDRSGEENTEVDADVPNVKVKAAPKKGVGQRQAPARNGGAGRRSKRPSKKEREAAIKARAEIKAEAEVDDDADGEGDTNGVTGAEGDMDCDSESQDGAHANHTGSPAIYQENQGNDEISATLLGITVEEFRNNAEETYAIAYAPTPRGYVDSEDEV